MKLLIVAALVAIAQAAPAPPSSPGPPAPMPAGCYVNDAYGPVSYKYAPGNVFPTDANHPHGLRLVDSAAHCCTLCQTYKNCSFWTYSAGGTPAQPTCYSFSGACCFLKTDAAKGQEQPDKASVVSGSTKPYPPVPTGPLTVTVDWNTEVITTQTAVRALHTIHFVSCKLEDTILLVQDRHRADDPQQHPSRRDLILC